MPIKPYDPKAKSTFLKAATEARAAGKPWNEVHTAAKAAGYPGTVKGISRMLDKVGTRKPSKPPEQKKTATKAGITPATKALALAAKPAELKPAAPMKKAPAATHRRKHSRPVVGKRYSPAMKSKIISAAIAARGSGKKWAEALQAAKAAGYRGSLQGIVKMIRASKRKKRGGRSVSKSGRPMRNGKMRRPMGRPPLKTVSVNSFGSIQAAVDRIVGERVRTALGRAISVLEHAR